LKRDWPIIAAAPLRPIKSGSGAGFDMKASAGDTDDGGKWATGEIRRKDFSNFSG
jgi:hypothetical protein